MKIFLRQLSDHQVEWDQTVKAEALDLPQDLFDCLSPLDIQAAFQRAGDTVIGEFAVSGRYRLTCCQCLEEFDMERTDQFEVIFDVTPMTEYIDFGDDIRQELIMAALFRPVCREDCKGLCPHCGVDLNKEKCQCKRD